MFKYGVLLFCITCVHGTIWLNHPGVNGGIPIQVHHEPQFMLGPQMNHFGSRAGLWHHHFNEMVSPYDNQELYLNPAGVNQFYQGGRFPPNNYLFARGVSIYEQHGQFPMPYDHGFNQNYIQAGMENYPGAGYCPPAWGINRPVGGINGIVKLPIYRRPILQKPRPLPKPLPQPLPQPPKTVQPVQPVQHLKLEPLPPRIDTAVPWEDTNIQTRLL